MAVMPTNGLPGILLALADGTGGNLTLHVDKLGNRVAAGLIVSDADNEIGNAYALDPLDLRVLIQRLRQVLSLMGMAAPESSADSELERMAAFATELRTVGYKDMQIEAETVDLTLARSSSLDMMTAIIERAYQKYRATIDRFEGQKSKEQKGGKDGDS